MTTRSPGRPGAAERKYEPMRHRYAGYKLNRTSSHRKALAKNMLRSFFLEFDRKGYIVTNQ